MGAECLRGSFLLRREGRDLFLRQRFRARLFLLRDLEETVVSGKDGGGQKDRQQEKPSPGELTAALTMMWLRHETACSLFSEIDLHNTKPII